MCNKPVNVIQSINKYVDYVLLTLTRGETAD